MRNYFFSCFLFNKFLNLLLKTGKKEKLEKKILKIFKKIDFYIFFEALVCVSLPFKFFPKRRRIGRHSYIYYNSLFYLTQKQQIEKSVFFLVSALKELLNFKTLQADLSLFFKNFILDKKNYLLNFSLKNKEEICFIKSIKHFRWS